MHDREQLWHPLDFVNHDILRAGVSRDQFVQPLGTGGIEALLSRREKVNPDSVRKGAAQPCALSCSP